jgi:hypothetical protein
MPDDTMIADRPPLPDADELNIVEVRIIVDRRRFANVRLIAFCGVS